MSGKTPTPPRMIRIRVLGLALLIIVAVVPLAVFGWLAVTRSERTAVTEVRDGNQRVAEAVAGRIESYLRRERQTLAIIGAAAVQASDAAAASALLEGYTLEYRHLRDLTVYRDGARWAADSAARPSPAFDALAATARSGGAAASPVRPADHVGTGGFAHTMTVAVPIVVVGQQRGVLVADVDLIGVWEPVNRVKVGEHGFVRLLSGSGELLAHGDPEERRYVFDADRGIDDALVAAARRGELALNQGGVEVVPTVADVPGTDWKVVVEQPVAEAFAPARAMRRDLYLSGAGVILLAVLIGLIAGRRVVRPLEQLRDHTRVLAGGDLLARADVPTRIAEVAALAGALDEMAAALKQLQDDARARERVTTFGRVAAGLAHDLRLPIETLSAACFDLIREPEDAGARAFFELTARSNLPRLREYMGDLLQLSREGEIEKRSEHIDPLAAAHQAVEQISANPQFRGIEFRVTGEAAPMWLNRSLFRRALQNLGANAARACFKSGRGDAGVTFQFDDSEEALEVRVIDQGSGMTAEQRDRILAGDFASEERTSGIGLGLGVVRHVVRGHGGTLEIHTELGKGSTFLLRLPRAVGRGEMPERIAVDEQKGPDDDEQPAA